MRFINIPSNISVWAGNGGELITAAAKHRVVMSLDYGVNLWTGGFCSVKIWEPSGMTPLTTQGGRWRIQVEGVDRFYGFLDNSSAVRQKGGYMRTYQLRDCLQAWDVLLTNKTYPDPPVSSGSYTVGTALSSMVNTVVGLSGIAVHSIPTCTMLVQNLYEDGVLKITNSSYLAEILRICQDIGYKPVADPGFGDVRIIDMMAGPQGILGLASDTLIDASFSVAATSIPATVLVADDMSGNGRVYGKLGTSTNYDGKNWAMTGINSVVWASTQGVEVDKLPVIAKQVYDLARGASQILTVKVAGPESSTRRIIGKELIWTDAASRKGSYWVFAHQTHIDAASYTTEYQGWIV